MRTLGRRRVGLATSLALAALLSGAPHAAAQPVAPEARCHTQGVSDGTRMSLVIVGSIVAPGADRTGITCHVFVDGGQIASVGRAGAGPVTVATGTATNIRLGPFQVCAEAFAEYPGGARWEKRC